MTPRLTNLMKHTYLPVIAGIIGGIGFSLSAETVTVSSGGSLSKAMQGISSPDALTIEGTLNAADFGYISKNLHTLKTLDLSNVTIQDYSGTPVLSNLTTSAAAELPANALSGMSLTSITLPSGITRIGEGALAGTDITTIAIPASVKSIGPGAFNSCTKLASVTLPATLEAIDSLAFAGCSKLTTVEYWLPAVAPGAFRNCVALDQFDAKVPIVSVGNGAFEGCASLLQFPFTASLTAIGDKAFDGSALTSVNLTQCEQLTSLGAWAFANCANLQKVTLPNSMTAIGRGAFFNDRKLDHIALPASLVEIPDYAMTNATALEYGDVITSSTERVGKYAYKGLEKRICIALPATLEYIGDGAMESWFALDSIDAQALNSVPELGEAVWSGVNKSNVKLVPKADMANRFREADQWREFKIELPSSLDNVEIDANAAATAGLKAFFEGKTLVVTALMPLHKATLINAAGQTLGESDANGATRLTMDTSRWSDRMYIVSVDIEGAGKAAVKLTR